MATEIVFYHLLHKPLEEALPQLLQKCVARDWKVVVQTGTNERCASLDAHLWTFKDDSFLPHGTKNDGYAEFQPIYLTDGTENPNNANVRFLVDQANPPELASYDRAVFIFDGQNENAVQEARRYWVDSKAKEFEVAYWQQTVQGGWERKA